MPWTFDLLLPTAERYASLRFRRVSRRFDASRLDYGEAVHLCAAVETLGLLTSEKILHWGVAARAEFLRLQQHLHAQGEDVAQAVEENRAAYSRDEGLRVLEVMREHGWTQKGVPEIVRVALLDMRDAGISQPKIAAATGLTLDQVRVIANGPRRVRTTVPLSQAGLIAQ